jgi:tight adherence protein C
LELAQWLLVLSMLVWAGALLRMIHGALREFEPAVPAARMPLGLLQPGVLLIAHYAGRWLRARWRAEQMARLLQAGLVGHPTPPEWFAQRCLLAVMAGGLGLAIAIWWGGIAWWSPAPGALAGWMFPDVWLRWRTHRRQRRIGAEWLLYLELLLAGLESGLSLRAALRLAVQSGPAGTVRAALEQARGDASAGCEIDEILRRLARRLRAPVPCATIDSLVPDVMSGAGLVRGMRSAIARHTSARLARAEYCARQAPRRILRPLTACFASSLILAAAAPLVARL